MQSQVNHFVRFAPEKIEYGIKRYTNETKRLYGVIEKHLSNGREWLAAGQYTIADMANFSWVYGHAWAGLSMTCDLSSSTMADACGQLATCHCSLWHKQLRNPLSHERRCVAGCQ